MNDLDTIVALATPKGSSALAVIRVSGDDTFSIICNYVKESDKFKKADFNKISVYKFISDKKIIDEITLVKYGSPKSFTGENMVEIICHGGELIINTIISALLKSNIRYAERGEFTRRAFLNGKKTLSEAESINQIIHSKTEIQRKNAINSYFGGYNDYIGKWKYDIEGIVSDLESQIEFNDDDDIAEMDFTKRIKNTLKRIILECNNELEKRDNFKTVENGISAAIVGPVNAGKSSLMNNLLGYERSIVDSHEGTTRDFISERLLTNDLDITFIDTAGLHQTNDSIEKKGIERSKELIKKCNILIWVTPADKEFEEDELKIKDEINHTIIAVINKTDITDNKNKEKFFFNNNIPFIKTSIINKENKDSLSSFIKKEVDNNSEIKNYETFILNTRQEELIKKSLSKLDYVLKNINYGEEIISLELQNILELYNDFFGVTVKEDIINRIFKEFCIGK